MGLWDTRRVTLDELGAPECWVELDASPTGGQLRTIEEVASGETRDGTAAVAVLNRLFAQMVLDHNLTDRQGAKLAPASEGHLATDLPARVMLWLAEQCGTQIQGGMAAVVPAKNSSRASSTPLPDSRTKRRAG